MDAITGGYHLSHYAALKSAMISLTTSLSNEVASEGIRVICWFILDESSYITGANIPVTGGL